MTVKIRLVLLLVLTLLTGVCPLRPRVLYVREGEMVVLQCPHDRQDNDGDAKLSWTSHNGQVMDLTSGVPTSAEQRQAGVLLYGRSLVILRASVKHQGNYSCSLGDVSSQSWFRLTVYPTQSREYDERTQYPATCYTQKSCRLNCPDVNIPSVNTPNITSNGIIWHKEGESIKDIYFRSVEEKDGGVYTCTRSYLYHGQIYHMTFRVALHVKPKKKLKKYAKITEPQDNEVFHVDLDSTVVIDCKAVLYSDFDEVFWLSDRSFVEKNNSLPVFYNLTWEDSTGEEKKVTASLVFRKVSKEDLSIRYTCKLESDHQFSSFVTITLTQKARPSPLSLALCTVCIMVVIAVTVVLYVKLKIDIALFLRDTLGCHRSISDGRSYDAYLMCYKSDTDAGLNEDDRKWLESVLEERFGYSLCLYNPDVVPGKAVAEAALDCIEESRAVVLVPTSPDSGMDSDLLNDLHAALVVQQTRLVLMKTETADVLSTGPLAEALQLLSKAGDCVTWKGRSSMLPSSSFCKQLRYYLPAPQNAPRLLSRAATQDANC